MDTFFSGRKINGFGRVSIIFVKIADILFFHTNVLF